MIGGANMGVQVGFKLIEGKGQLTIFEEYAWELGS